LPNEVTFREADTDLKRIDVDAASSDDDGI